MSTPESSQAVGDIAAKWCVTISQAPLSANDAALFEQWLDADPVHLEAFTQVASRWQALDRINDLDSVGDLTKLRSSSMETYTIMARSKFAKVWHDRRIWMPLAATILIMLTGVVWSLTQTPARYNSGDAPIAGILLTDGSQLTLDADSEVRAKFGIFDRHLWLVKGRARFNVAKDRSRPFKVEAGGRNIIATGTQFSVEKLGPQLRIALFEGHIAVFDKGTIIPRLTGVAQINATADYSLSAQQTLLFEAETSNGQILAATEEDNASWSDGQLIFKDTSLEHAVIRVNRYTQNEIILDTNIDGQTMISGIFKAGDTEAFLSGVSDIGGFSYYRKNNYYYIRQGPARPSKTQ